MDGDDADLPVIPARGRARSHSMHEATHADLATEIDALNGGSAAPVPAAGAGAPASAAAKPGQLSKKTITMLTDLAAASGVPPELETAHEHVLSEADLAERELAAEEQKRALEQRDAAAAAPPQAAAGAASRPRKQKGDEKDYDVLIKLLLLGDGGVGKTSLSECTGDRVSGAPSREPVTPLSMSSPPQCCGSVRTSSAAACWPRRESITRRSFSWSTGKE